MRYPRGICRKIRRFRAGSAMKCGGSEHHENIMPIRYRYRLQHAGPLFDRSEILVGKNSVVDTDVCLISPAKDVTFRYPSAYLKSRDPIRGIGIVTTIALYRYRELSGLPLHWRGLSAASISRHVAFDADGDRYDESHQHQQRPNSRLDLPTATQATQVGRVTGPSFPECGEMTGVADTCC
jgi:hypothetical protein